MKAALRIIIVIFSALGIWFMFGKARNLMSAPLAYMPEIIQVIDADLFATNSSIRICMSEPSVSRWFLLAICPLQTASEVSAACRKFEGSVRIRVLDESGVCHTDIPLDESHIMTSTGKNWIEDYCPKQLLTPESGIIWYELESSLFWGKSERMEGRPWYIEIIISQGSPCHLSAFNTYLRRTRRNPPGRGIPRWLFSILQERCCGQSGKID